MSKSLTVDLQRRGVVLPPPDPPLRPAAHHIRALPHVRHHHAALAVTQTSAVILRLQLVMIEKRDVELVAGSTSHVAQVDEIAVVVGVTHFELAAGERVVGVAEDDDVGAGADVGVLGVDVETPSRDTC